MATPRLLFLYPTFYKPSSALKGRPSPDAIERVRGHGGSSARQRFSAAAARGRLEPLRERHGTAIEPPLELRGDVGAWKKDVGKSLSGAEGGGGDVSGGNKGAVGGADPRRTLERMEAVTSSDTGTASSSSSELKSRPATEALPKPTSAAAAAATTTPADTPTETVLHIDPTSSSTARKQEAAHLHAPAYVHHFDTYTIVRDLETKGFTQQQSVTLMKAVRGLLGVNLDKAGLELVSKSDVENGTYLFRAACSELRTEIQTKRRVETERMRTERAQLQYEVEMLHQKLTQELLTLKDHLKGLFDDRKMAVRIEQREMESSIEELNYKITVSLKSDVKSEVESLRWLLTRRAALAIASMAFLILASLRYNSYRTATRDLHQRESSDHQRNRTSSSSSPLSSSSAALAAAAGITTASE